MYALLDTMLLWAVRVRAGAAAAQQIAAAVEWLYPAAARNAARYRRSRICCVRLFTSPRPCGCWIASGAASR